MINPREVFGKDYQEFLEVDPFNPHTEVSGFISRKPNEFYGALIITKVNNKAVPDQLIMSSPKMHYPFYAREDGTRNYRFPSAKSIELYEKLDGTCIIAYTYTNGIDRFFSYKTRLRPFLGSSRFGDFYNMWKEVSAPHIKEIKKLMLANECNIVFELHGSRNTHLILYKNSLDIALLFGVTNTGRILSPTDLKGLGNIPTVALFKVIDKDYVWNYEEIRKELQSKLTQVEEGYYSGMEGTVWYLHTPDGLCIQAKCKPETIEAIHFSAGAGGLCKNAVITTCWNAFENTDILTFKFIKELLQEEFDPEVIEAHRPLIEKCMTFVTNEAEFRNTVLAEYKATGMNILLNKPEVMRILSSKFQRNTMRKVYGIIATLG